MGKVKITDVSHEFKDIPKGALEDFKIGLEVFIDNLIKDGILIKVKTDENK